MLTVSVDRDDVERQLGSGGLACPACSGVLAGWGWARERRVRGLEGWASGLTPRRARCRGCGQTHVLLPVTCLARRADETGVIGLALELKAAGAGHRPIAVLLGRPPSTVRGWLRALTSAAGEVRRSFTALAAGLAADLPLPAVAGSPLGDAVSAVAAAGAAAAAVLGVRVVARWHLAAAVTSGLLLAPCWRAGVINASWPWAAGV